MLCDISMKLSWQSHHYFDSLKELIDSVKFSERHLVKNNWISTAARIMLGQPLWDARLGKPDKWTAMGVYWWRECRVAAVSMLVICSLGCWTSAQLKCRYIYGDSNLTLQQKQNAGTHRSGQTWQQKRPKSYIIFKQNLVMQTAVHVFHIQSMSVWGHTSLFSTIIL